MVHERGLGAASVRDIVEAAGVPQGPFSNHFASKEAFGLEIIELYHAGSSQLVEATLRSDALPPLARLRTWIELPATHLKKNEMKNGCLYGNFSAEASEHSEAIRQRITNIFAQNTASVLDCLHAAAEAGELSSAKGGRELEQLAGFIISSMQGAILMAKVERCSAPVERFVELLFSVVLR